MQKLKEIKPNHDNQYWVNYWINMNKELDCNHFRPQLLEVEERIKKNGCGKIIFKIYKCRNSYLCDDCKELLNRINDALK